MIQRHQIFNIHNIVDIINNYVPIINIDFCGKYIEDLSTNESNWAMYIIDEFIYRELINLHSDSTICTYLSGNCKALNILKKYPDIIDIDTLCTNSHSRVTELLKEYDYISHQNWNSLCIFNPNIIELLGKYCYRDMCFKQLSHNPAAIDLLVKNKDKIDFKSLCSNKSFKIVELLQEYIDKHGECDINWKVLSSNPYAIELLEKYKSHINWYTFSNNSQITTELIYKNIDKINFKQLSLNEGKHIVPILEKYIDKLCWNNLSENYNALDILEKNPKKVCLEYLAINRNNRSIQFFQNHEEMKKRRYILLNDVF